MVFLHLLDQRPMQLTDLKPPGFAAHLAPPAPGVWNPVGCEVIRGDYGRLWAETSDRGYQVPQGEAGATDSSICRRLRRHRVRPLAVDARSGADRLRRVPRPDEGAEAGEGYGHWDAPVSMDGYWGVGSL
ncbi:MAG: hypothetical protein Q7W05_14130 [Deltaproteobacteria bacterium]|nr:hypothetical protein [Deltaproteobacteria bacterium]